MKRRDFLKVLGSSPLVYFASTQFGRRLSEGEADLPNIIIFVLDTLSARHVSLLGYSRQTTPNIARLAERANVYHNHYSSGNFTTSGTASLLTGVYPWHHRGIHLIGTVLEKYKNENLFSYLSDKYYISAATHNPLVRLLLDQFKEHIHSIHNMNVLGLSGKIFAEDWFESDLESALSGESIVRGSDFIFPSTLFLSTIERLLLDRKIKIQSRDSRIGEYPLGIPHNQRGIYFLLEDAIDWIQENLSNLPKPFLGYYHLLPPHEPYRPREEFFGLFEDQFKSPKKAEHPFSDGLSYENLHLLRRLYDEFLAHADAEFGRLYDFLNNTGLLKNSLVIVTSDHGQLFARGIHGHVTRTMYQPLLHVPLLISQPSQRERKDIYSPTSCVDIVPTILKFLGEKIPIGLEGEVLPGFDSQASKSHRSLYALDAKENSKFKTISKGTFTLIHDDYKLINYQGYDDFDDLYELYNISDDPEELEDLSTVKKSLSKDMHEFLLNNISAANNSR